MNVHELKCWPEFFEPIIRGKKTFEYRKDDRDYKVGDVLVLHEWDRVTREYTGRQATAFVPYLMDAGNFSVIMSIEIQEMQL